MVSSLDIEAIRPLSEDIIKDVSKDSLCLLAMNVIEKNGEQPSIENIIVAAYRMFPSKFSLPRYPQFPDSNAVHMCYFHMKHSKGQSRHWVKGTPKLGLTITDQGMTQIQKYVHLISPLRDPESSSTSKRLPEYETKFADKLGRSEAFRKFSLGNQSQITNEDVCFALLIPVGHDARKAANALEKAFRIVRENSRNDLLSFLEFVKKNHTILFDYRGARY